MDIEKILKYLLPIIPEPLRRHVATGMQEVEGVVWPSQKAIDAHPAED